MGHALGNNYGKFYSFQSKPVILDAQWTVDSTNASGVTGVKGQGIKNIFMQSSTTPATGNPFVNSTSAGYALIELEYNYNQIFGGPWNMQAPVTGGALAINGSALTAGVPYQIVTVGVGTKGSTTINCVDDVSGNLASTWFSLYDSYGNTFIIWFSVDGVGTYPSLGAAAAWGTPGLHYVQCTIAADDTDDTIADALEVIVDALPSGVSGVYSFTSSATTGTLTVTNTKDEPLPGPATDGVASTGFDFALVNYTSNLQDWQAVGLPKGVVPVVGASFVATASGYSTGGGSTGTVKALGVSGVVGMEYLGITNYSMSPIPMGGSSNAGGLILVKFLKSTFAAGAYTPAGTVAAPVLTMNSYTPAGSNASDGPPETFTGTPAVLTGTNSAPAFTGTAASLTGTITYGAGAPADGSKVYIQFLLEQGTPVGGNNE